MAEKHILSLEVPTVADCEIFTIRDTSQYSSKLDIDCAELLITSPGFNKPELISVTPEFYLNLNNCDLGIQTTNCGDQRTEIKDGVYIIKYSVSPNTKVYVEYNHLRVTNILNLYYKTLCDINITPCDPTYDKQELVVDMKYIRTVIDAAVAKVEYCQSPAEGMELYNFAKKKLQKISCRTVGC